jgi:predicted transposase YbfD/YdcC
VELRTLKTVSVAGFGFPHTAQVIQVTRKTRDLRTRRWRTVIIYAITSLTFAQASPARLADWIRGHWAIENGLHWVRDVTFAEDASRVRTGGAPQVMACLRNLVIGALSQAGPVNLATTLRHHARDPHRPLATLGITLGVGRHPRWGGGGNERAHDGELPPPFRVVWPTRTRVTNIVSPLSPRSCPSALPDGYVQTAW